MDSRLDHNGSVHHHHHHHQDEENQEVLGDFDAILDTGNIYAEDYDDSPKSGIFISCLQWEP